jgi:hypothetical protein
MQSLGARALWRRCCSRNDLTFAVQLTAIAAAAVLAATPANASRAGQAHVTARAFVAVLGTRVGPWRINQPYDQRPGLLRRQTFRRNFGPGCVAGPALAALIEWYDGLRLSWYDDGKGGFFLADVATTRQGDRTSKGLIIGTSTLAAARKMYGQAARLILTPANTWSFGTSELSLYQQTGYESGRYLDLWFNRNAVLVAIAAGASGC